MPKKNAIKHFGRVYTPRPVVDRMLDIYPGTDLMNVSVCDPACGDGEFLVPLATRICEKWRRAKVNRRRYTQSLRKLVGFDIDGEALDRCRARLDEVTTAHGMGNVNWQLQHVDAIDTESWRSWAGRFDYVVGNPPYVRIQHLEKDRRDRIRNGPWQFMEGCTDLYLLFFDMGIQLLKERGKLVYITPNSWLRSHSARAFRRYLRDHHRIHSILDFGQHQAFPQATTYAAITALEKNGDAQRTISVDKCTAIVDEVPTFLNGYHIDANDDMWQPLSRSDRQLLRSWRVNTLRLSEVAEIRVGIQTLADNVFIVPTEVANFEPGAVRRIYKASVMKRGQDVIERIVIYPYRNGKLIPEQEFRELFPKAYRWLTRNKCTLLARDKGTFDPKGWYGYGRDVSITSVFGEKILTSGMNKEPNFQLCSDPDALFYSGYCVKPLPKVSTRALLNELNSDRMSHFVRITSRPYQGGWFSYAKSFIKDFPVSERVLGNE